MQGGAEFNGQPLTKALKRRIGFVMQVRLCDAGRAGQGTVVRRPRRGRVAGSDNASCLGP